MHYYTIKDVAHCLHIAPSTLRYYEKIGILPDINRSPGGIRLYGESDLELLRIVECLKKTGMPLKDIKTFVNLAKSGDSTVNERLKLIKERRIDVEKQMQELGEVLRVLEYKEWYYSVAKAHGTTAVPRDMSDSQIPPEFVAVRNALKDGV